MCATSCAHRRHADPQTIVGANKVTPSSPFSLTDHRQAAKAAALWMCVTRLVEATPCLGFPRVFLLVMHTDRSD